MRAGDDVNRRSEPDSLAPQRGADRGDDWCAYTVQPAETPAEAIQRQITEGSATLDQRPADAHDDDPKRRSPRRSQSPVGGSDSRQPDCWHEAQTCPGG